MPPLLHCHKSIMILMFAALVGCAEAPRTQEAGSGSGRLLLPASAPRLVVSDSDQVAETVAQLARLAPGLGDGVARRVEPESVAFLQGSAAGRVFLRAAGARALAMGEPPERCPAIGLVTRSEAGASGSVAEAALLACLEDRADSADCGCRLLAANDTLLAPLERFAHAPGVGARLVGLGPALAGPLVAREDPEARPDGATLVTFTGAWAAVATAVLGADGSATLELADGTRFEGHRERHGWRRGRLTERLLLRSASGARVIALIGFEPDEFARDGARLAAWPRGLPG